MDIEDKLKSVPEPKPHTYKPMTREQKMKAAVKRAEKKAKLKLEQAEKLKKEAQKDLKGLKKVENAAVKSPAIISLDEFAEAPPAVQDNANIIFSPNQGPQTDFLAATEREVFFGGSRGGGKASYINDLVATPFGFKRMGDIEIGDQVSNPDGSVSRVIQVHPQGVQELYKCTFIDGASCTVTKDHLWVVHKTCATQKADRRYYPFNEEDKILGKLFTTSQLIDELAKEGNHNFLIPLSNPIEFTIAYKVNPRRIDPYVLGVLIGDGCLRQGSVSFSSADQFIIEEVGKRTGCEIYSYGVSHRIKNCKELLNDLKNLKIYNNLAHSKFIPECYKRASTEIRLELLQGLMDTDGTVDNRGHLSYCTISKQLAEDVQWLVRSLGGKATITTRIPKFTYKNERKIGQLAYIIYIQTKFNSKLFKLERKKARCEDGKFNGGVSELCRRLISIEKVEDGEAQCITVDNPNGLYITNDFIVTHNSYSLIVDPLRYCDKEAHRALILRRTMPELRDLINHSQRLYPKAFPKVKWREQEKEWRFPSGARIEFGYAENRQDALRYQGQSYTWIGVDELPQFETPDILNDLRGSLRSVDPEIPEFLRASGNPGNVGSAWVKDMFITPAPPNTRFYVEVDTPKGKKQISRRFIPAKLSDNPYLTQNDNYLIMLSSLPEVQRRQWLEGDWDIWEGAAFPEFSRNVHVVPRFEVPRTWIKFRACDWGYSSEAVVLWFAIDYDGTLYVYREFVTKLMTADVFADRVLELERNDVNLKYGIIDASLWQKRGDVGPSIIEVMAKHGLRWRPSDRTGQSRRNGKLEIHRRFKINPDTGKPSLLFFNNCVNLIRDIPTLPLDENDPEDVDTKFNKDHTYDALRYGCMSRMMSPSQLGWLIKMSDDQLGEPFDKTFGY